MNSQNIFFIVVALLYFSLSFTACTEDERKNPLDSELKEVLNKASEWGSYETFILPGQDDFQYIPQDPKNPITAEKIALGNLLFFETGVALAPVHAVGKGSYSCGSCHVPSAGFLPGRVQGIADGGLGFGDNGERRDKYPFYEEDELDTQGIRPMSQVNVAFGTNASWNGEFGAGGVNKGTEGVWDNKESTMINHQGFTGVESQNMVGLKLHRMIYNDSVMTALGYTQLFDNAFPEIPVEERYTIKAASFAISSFTRTIIPFKAPFQEWLKGEKGAMSDAEKRGAILFFSKAGCVNCHQGPALNAMKFEALGVEDLYQNGGFNTDAADKKNLGRGGFTGVAEDLYKFRVPQLYNLKKARHYFHGSSKSSLREVVEYFNNAIPENPNVPAEQISPYFRPLLLTEEEMNDLTTFITEALYDPDLQRYVPEAVLSGNCIPNNDPFSQLDLGCN